MSVADGVGHGLFFASLIYSSSLPRIIVVSSQSLHSALWLRCGVSCASAGRFRLILALRFQSMRWPRAAAAALQAGKVGAVCRKNPCVRGRLGPNLRWSGPGYASRPLPILHQSAGGPALSPKKNTQTRLGISACRLCSLCTRIAYNLLRTCRASRFANNCAAALAARGRDTTVTRSPASEEKAARRSRAPQP